MTERVELIKPESQNYGATRNDNTTMKSGLKVDFVLVFKNPNGNEAASVEEQNKRITFEKNLEKTGLIMEHEQGRFPGVRTS